MVYSHKFAVVGTATFTFPYAITYKILLTEHIFTQLSQVRFFIIINRNKDDPIVAQQFLSDFQSRVHHIEPIGVEASVGGGVAGESIALVVVVAGDGAVFLAGLGEVVLVDEVIAGVVGRVDVDHLDLAPVVVAEELQHIQVIPLNVEVLRGVEVDGLLAAGSQGRPDGGVCQEGCGPFAGPVEFVALLPSLDERAGQLLLQDVKVNCIPYPPRGSRTSLMQLGKSFPMSAIWSCVRSRLVILQCSIVVLSLKL